MEVKQTPFVKELAANDRPTRDKALHSLQTYLSGQRTFTPIELLKLWKGLFYCLWLCDRPLPQQALCNSLSSLVLILPSDTTVPFLHAFWQTMQREWTNIDVLRMEKFLLLVRRYLGATFDVCKRRGWEEEVVREHMKLLGEVTCNMTDVRVPNGLRYHVIDVYVDELERVGAFEEETGAGHMLEVLLSPLRGLGEKCLTKTVRVKAREALEDERLPGKEKVVDKRGEQQEEEEWGGIED